MLFMAGYLIAFLFALAVIVFLRASIIFCSLKKRAVCVFVILMAICYGVLFVIVAHDTSRATSWLLYS
jgi:tryptophan-rich sensory protein